MKFKVEITVPAHNESTHLEKNILLLYNKLKSNLKPYSWNITIAENGSSDSTYEIAKSLSQKHKNIKVRHYPRPSKSNAIKQTWLKSNSDVLLFIDVDNSVHGEYIKPFIEQILQGQDIVTGNRGSRKTNRPVIRKFLSFFYNDIILKFILKIKVKDAQCGLKAVNKKTNKLLTRILSEDTAFIDTELLAFANYYQLKVKEIPVNLDENRKNVMNIYRYIPNFLKGVLLIKFGIFLERYNNHYLAKIE